MSNNNQNANSQNPMTKEAAQRIQSTQDRKGSQGDQSFKSRAMSASEKNQDGKKGK